MATATIVVTVINYKPKKKEETKELLVSKKGLGYLIMYGSQVFNINLVITSVFILGIVSYLMYYLISWVEKKLIKNI